MSICIECLSQRKPDFLYRCAGNGLFLLFDRICLQWLQYDDSNFYLSVVKKTAKNKGEIRMSTDIHIFLLKNILYII